MVNILESVISQFSGPEFVGRIGSAFLGTDGINRSCGAVIPEVKKGANGLFVVILLHARSAVFACMCRTV